jgi:thiol:disulfide interchange protein DsbC
MKILLNILVVCLLSVAAMSQADEEQQQPEKSEKSEFTQKLQQYFPNIKPDSVRPSPVNGLYEVIIGPRVYYLSQDARYLVPASIIDLQAGINLTKPRVHMARLGALERIGEDNMITFSPAEPEYIITAFTDIDCVYCRKMHSQIKDYNKLGIAIRYLFYPRAGMGSKSYKTSMSVWCNKDRKKAFTDAKAGKEITFKSCENPISAHMKLVQQMELRGTPALLLPSGELIESYIPPAELLKLLRSRASK